MQSKWVLCLKQSWLNWKLDGVTSSPDVGVGEGVAVGEGIAIGAPFDAGARVGVGVISAVGVSTGVGVSRTVCVFLWEIAVGLDFCE